MARYIGPKHKLARREKTNIFGKTSASLERRLNVPPGMHGHRGGRKLSDYGQQLREKQKAKRTYGVLEKQFYKYFKQALKEKGATGEKLLQLLETRLDNIIFKLGFTPSRNMARQLVSHGHVLIDNAKVNIPSYNLTPGAVISFKQKTLEIPAVKKALEEKSPNIPVWLDRKGPVGKLVKVPSLEEIDSELNPQLIVEFYSR